MNILYSVVFVLQSIDSILRNEHKILFACKHRLRYSREQASHSLEVMQFICSAHSLAERYIKFGGPNAVASCKEALAACEAGQVATELP